MLMTSRSENYIKKYYQNQHYGKLKYEEKVIFSSYKFSPTIVEKSNLTNKNFDIIFYENKKIKRYHTDKFIGQLDNLSKFDDILALLETRVFSKNFYLLQRIEELKELCDSEQDCEISLKSLKSMLLFVFVEKNLSNASVTLNESGYFQLSWKKDRNNLITLRFKEEYLLDYVIFRPSDYIDKRIILNGSMNVLDFIDYIQKLKLTLHKE